MSPSLVTCKYKLSSKVKCFMESLQHKLSSKLRCKHKLSSKNICFMERLQDKLSSKVIRFIESLQDKIFRQGK